MRVLLFCSAATALLLTSCDPAARDGARARIIADKRDLIGGPHALGDLGDYLLENADARFILQQPGYSRGFGVFGGGLIDADIQRPTRLGDETNATGRDNFAEMFPAFFLVAMEPRDIYLDRQNRKAMEILPDAGDGSASIIVRGRASQFLALTEFINNTVVGPEFLVFETIYKLPARGRTLEITTRVINDGAEPAYFKNKSFTGSVKLDVPFGDVLLFGAGNQVFAPGDGGFDLRYRLTKKYAENVQLPALPGITVDYLASRGRDVSYGFFVPISPPPRSGEAHRNFVMDHAAAYGERSSPGKILVPFFAQAFTGVFHTQGPRVLGPGEAFEYSRYFVVGDGDVASVAQEVHRVRGDTVGTVSGRVVDKVMRSPLVGANVIALDAAGQPFCQATTRAEGVFSMPLPPGPYRLIVTATARDPSIPQPIEVGPGGVSGVELTAEPTGQLSVIITDELGARAPSKVTLVSSYGAAEAGMDPKDFLFNLSIGEGWRNVDFETDLPTQAGTRRYIENIFNTHNGAVSAAVRPGKYEVWVSRGPEYDAWVREVEIVPGGSAELAATVKRSVDTSGYVSADFHVHSVASIDSSIMPEPRVTTYAAEGVEVMVSTDHNYVMDFRPATSRLGLDPWMTTFVGLELTTLEMGHFNGYPLRYEIPVATHGSFEWSSKTPNEIFESLRGLGQLDRSRTLVQVNHPRDTILGYFNNFVWDQETGIAEGQTDPVLGINIANYPNFHKDNFSLDFDVLEVFNGKRFEYLHTYRVPSPLPPPPLPMTIPATGEPVRDTQGKIAFPGVVEDWYTLMKQGHVFTGVANSDSHGSSAEEAGYPRTYIKVASDQPGRLTPEELVDSLRGRNALMTNGPFITVTVGEHTPMGGTVSATGGMVRVRGEVRTASWVRPSELAIFVGGAVVRTLPIPGDARVFTYDETVPVGARDTFVTVEVHGGDNMFPVVTTFDEPPLLINDAITAIGGSLGFGGNPYGNLRPATTFKVTPFALTNPVFVDVDGNGAYDAPGLGIAGTPSTPARITTDIPAPTVGQVQGPPRLVDLIRTPARGQALDIRRVFQAFDHHHGGH